MGVTGLNRNLNKCTNFSFYHGEWVLDRQVYTDLSTKQQVEIDKNKNSYQNGKVNLIIDASALFYYLSGKISWFVYDNLNLLELLKEYLHYFLSIKNLGKLIFVFDGVNPPIKDETTNGRRKNRISSIKKYFDQVTTSNVSPNQINLYINKDNNKPLTLSPSPLINMTFIQFLKDASILYNNIIKIKFSIFEADSYISEIANSCNGYVISNDSDFFIYRNPGYINLDSLEFPSSPGDNNFVIKYKLCTRKMILEYFSLTDDTLPIFATLCGNDYLKIENYNQLKSFFRFYSKSHRSRESTQSIEYFIYKNIVNFILDMKNISNSRRLNNHEGITPLQESIIENICNTIQRKVDPILDNGFKNILIESVKQYNINNDFINDENHSINEDISNSYNSGNFYYQLLNVLIKYQFECSYYFENIDKESCWNITKDIRKVMYEFIVSRNFMSEKEIEEISRDGLELNSIKVEINPIYQNIFDLPNEDIFNKYYLNNFESNTDKVKSLPYYLIPVASSLRYLLKKKVEENLFVYKKDDQLYNHLPNASKSVISSTQTALHYYEFEALLASSIAALTLTYLNVSSAYIDDIESLNLLSSLSLDSNDKFTIEDNIQINDQMLDQNSNYNNMYSHMRLRNKRSLELKNNEAIEILQKNSKKFKNAIHIFSEFSNILIMNSYMLQVLKLIEKLPSFSSFYSMYSYVWEGAYYSMIESFEIDNNNNNNNMVSSIFRNLFNVNDLNNSEKDNYINKLEKVYLRMLNAISKSFGDLNVTDKFI